MTKIPTDINKGIEALIKSQMETFLGAGDLMSMEGILYKTVIQETEKALLRTVMDQTHNNQLRAAAILGINRNTLGRKLREYNLHTVAPV